MRHLASPSIYFITWEEIWLRQTISVIDFLTFWRIESKELYSIKKLPRRQMLLLEFFKFLSLALYCSQSISMIY